MAIKRKSTSFYRNLPIFGGDGEDRTLDLLNAIQALSQLSYAPILFILFVNFLPVPRTAMVYYHNRIKIASLFFKKIKFLDFCFFEGYIYTDKGLRCG